MTASNHRPVPTAPSARLSFRADRSGAAALVFAMALVPLVGFAGAAIDYSRISAARESVQKALDGGALAGAARLQLSDAEVRRLVENHVRANLPPELADVPISVTIAADRTGVRVTSDFVMPTRFMSILGFDVLGSSIVAEARLAAASAEIAIALDVTGTMRSHIPALRRATQELIDMLQPGGTANENVRISLVPYVSAVNVSGHPDHMRWMDVTAQARFHGENFEGLEIEDDRCPRPPEPPPGPDDDDDGDAVVSSGGQAPPPAPTTGGDQNRRPAPAPIQRGRSPDLGFLAPELVDPAGRSGLVARIETGASAAFAAFLEAIGPGAAHASGAWPYGSMTEFTPVRCPEHEGPRRVNHFDLFAAMGVPWAGCVEARPMDGNLDVSEAPPRVGSPDSFFVPYLWPDEDDATNHYDVRNNYLPDGPIPSWASDVHAPDRQRWVWKYNSGVRPDVDDASFLTRGPNAACPQPLTPLTSDRTVLRDAVASLRAYAASGTNIAEGLVWAWRTLSPTFLPGEARPYDRRNLKYVILMTDGFNEVVGQDGAGVPQHEAWWNKSDYGGIGYAERHRLRTSDLRRITERLDERTARVCDGLRARDVQVFTVLFDPVGHTAGTGAQELLARCATNRATHVHRATSAEGLVQAFRTIGADILALRLTE